MTAATAAPTTTHPLQEASGRARPESSCTLDHPAASWRRRLRLRGSGCGAPMRAGVPPRLPRADLPWEAGGAPDWERLEGPGARGGACSRGQDGALKPEPAGRAGRGRGRRLMPLPVRRLLAPLPLPLLGPHTCQRAGDGREAAPASGAWGPEVGFGPPRALASGAEGGARRTPHPGTARGRLWLCCSVPARKTRRLPGPSKDGFC